MSELVTIKPEPSAIYYDNSMLENHRKCPRMHLLRNILDWAPEKTSHDLIFGLAWHSTMDIVWQFANSSLSDLELLEEAMVAFQEVWDAHYPPEQQSAFINTTNNQDDLYPKTPGRAREMCGFYIIRYRARIAKYSILGIEVPFIVPITIEDLGHIFYIGRFDKVYEYENAIYFEDHKTTKSGKDYFLNSFSPNNQMDGYLYAGGMTYGPKFWGGFIDGALCQKGATKTPYDPTLPPGIGFPRVPLQRHISLLEAWLWETTYEIALVLSGLEMLKSCSSEDAILKAFPKRTTACGYYRGCVYRNVCSFVGNPLKLSEPPTGFKVEKWVPFEILDPTKEVKPEAISEGGE